MLRTITVMLLLLIPLGGALRAQTTAEEEATETEEATNDFLGLEWGAGIGVMGAFGGADAVEKASIDANNIVRVEEEGDLRPQLFLEMHVFLNPKANTWRRYQRSQAATEMKAARDSLDNVNIEKMAGPTDSTGRSGRSSDDFAPPLIGFGPFIALQSSDNSAVDALTLGGMVGFRKSPKDTSSVNVGLGLSFDPSVQVLGGGFEDGREAPENETAVRYKKEGRFGWVLMTSFTF